MDIELSTERVALIGVNGSGKTTLMRSMLGLLRHSGTLMVGDAACAHLPPERTGFVPQDVDFPLLLTVQECVGMAADLKGLPDVDRSEAVTRVLTAVDLIDERHVRASRLSGGQQRRLACAQAFVHDPQILLMDEPTAGLDPIQRERLRGILQDLPKDRLVLVTTHILEDVAEWAERFLVLSEGEITHDVQRDELGDPGQRLGALNDLLALVPSR
ncbi:ABC transporter ATP-binding protein [Janibacter anophelis]|uniref:ABC transporter ATP-binding protein n=1 Tax=Janibacter anophelis TaxID=319054 RepID=UPI00082A4736|nr:ABC transporter ATP-binding protein [Janibacter anophelis]